MVTDILLNLLHLTAAAFFIHRLHHIADIFKHAVNMVKPQEDIIFPVQPLQLAVNLLFLNLNPIIQAVQRLEHRTLQIIHQEMHHGGADIPGKHIHLVHFTELDMHAFRISRTHRIHKTLLQRHGKIVKFLAVLVILIKYHRLS